MLGRQVMKDYVVRKCIGTLPAEYPDARHLGAAPSSVEVSLVPRMAEAAGPVSFLEERWKPVHIRDGYFPRRVCGVKADLADVNPLQQVHWALPKRSALDSLRQAAGVKGGPGIRKVSEAPAGARLRQRARWVLSLNPDKRSRWLGGLLSGRWTPDLSREFAHPSAAALVAARGGEVKFLGGGTLKKTHGEGDGKVVELAYVNAVHEGTCFRLFPELLALLASYATFRKRGPTLVSALRTRGLEWAKAQKLTAEETADMIGPTTAMAYFPSAQEIAGQKLLRGADAMGSLPEAQGWWSADV